MDNESQKAPEIRQRENKKILIAQLAKMPIVESACQRASVARSSYYRWRSEDEEFRKAADAAIEEGESFVTDLTESQLVALIREKSFPAIQMWLRHHHPKYSNKVELSGNLKIEEEPLTPEQKKLVAKAMKLAGLEYEGDSSE